MAPVKLGVICPVEKIGNKKIEYDFPEEEYKRVQEITNAAERIRMICDWLKKEELGCADPECDTPLEKHYFQFHQ